MVSASKVAGQRHKQGRTQAEPDAVCEQKAVLDAEERAKAQDADEQSSHESVGSAPEAFKTQETYLPYEVSRESVTTSSDASYVQLPFGEQLVLETFIRCRRRPYDRKRQDELAAPRRRGTSADGGSQEPSRQEPSRTLPQAQVDELLSRLAQPKRYAHDDAPPEDELARQAREADRAKRAAIDVDAMVSRLAAPRLLRAHSPAYGERAAAQADAAPGRPVDYDRLVDLARPVKRGASCSAWGVRLDWARPQRSSAEPVLRGGPGGEPPDQTGGPAGPGSSAEPAPPDLSRGQGTPRRGPPPGRASPPAAPGRGPWERAQAIRPPPEPLRRPEPPRAMAATAPGALAAGAGVGKGPGYPHGEASEGPSPQPPSSVDEGGCDSPGPGSPSGGSALTESRAVEREGRRGRPSPAKGARGRGGGSRAIFGGGRELTPVLGERREQPSSFSQHATPRWAGGSRGLPDTPRGARGGPLQAVEAMHHSEGYGEGWRWGVDRRA
uniref:Uncharacterized protein n=1 Tax=Alexandrium monilatum TaxID=311494 RepID=A0A7S4SBR7_9DINO|mmetsp:Transcript_46708/g.144639  ORF Transcript_46708/g.144639 Transcript_46708/m.144639 type:complete len:497 (+) Transcript_46708:136-1626(+)